MPVKNAEMKQTTLAAHKQLSIENLLAAWLLSDGWEVFPSSTVRNVSH